MITEYKSNYVLIKPEAGEILTEPKKKSGFIDLFKEKSVNFKDENIIIDLSGFDELNYEDIAPMLPESDKYRENGNSFVIVCKVNGVPEETEELIIVPTLKEAEDVIDLEDIERDLGI